MEPKEVLDLTAPSNTPAHNMASPSSVPHVQPSPIITEKVEVDPPSPSVEHRTEPATWSQADSKVSGRCCRSSFHLSPRPKPQPQITQVLSPSA